MRGMDHYKLKVKNFLPSIYSQIYSYSLVNSILLNRQDSCSGTYKATGLHLHSIPSLMKNLGTLEAVKPERSERFDDCNQEQELRELGLQWHGVELCGMESVV